MKMEISTRILYNVSKEFPKRHTLFSVINNLFL